MPIAPKVTLKLCSENARFVAQIGRYRQINDQIHHIGDDMGDLITEAYRTVGVSAAVDALVGYFGEFNANRAAHGTPEFTSADATAQLPWAFKPNTLKKNKIDQVRKGFRQLRP